MTFAEFHAIPTWTLYAMMHPFLPKKHPWKYRNFTLEDWAAGRTEICKQFDTGFWIILFNEIFLILFFAGMKYGYISS